MTAMRTSARRMGLAWLALLVLIGAEAGVAFLRPGAFGVPLLLLAMAGTLAIVMLLFMRLREASGLSQTFAVGGLLWLAILLGLGSIDPLTRTDTPTPVQPGPQTPR